MENVVEDKAPNDPKLIRENSLQVRVDLSVKTYVSKIFSYQSWSKSKIKHKYIVMLKHLNFYSIQW